MELLENPNKVSCRNNIEMLYSKNKYNKKYKNIDFYKKNIFIYFLEDQLFLDLVMMDQPIVLMEPHL